MNSTVMPQSSEIWADVFIELLRTENGGRKYPLDLCNDNPGQYRPHFRVIGGSGELLGVAFMDGPDEAVFPGGSTNATVKCLYRGESSAELVEGAKFEILEGPNVVGRGVVTRR
jgi:translation elongation factor EF-Tu-like GTPase